MSGGGSEGERGILEASPGVLALLVVFFLVVTLGIEHGLHFVKHTLAKRKKKGLLAAVTNLSNELMLLGVASLLLTALEPVATRICMKSANQMQPWLSNVQGCACCLTRTTGVSKCFIEDRQCPADFEHQCGVDHKPLSLVKRLKYVKPEPDHSNTTAAGAAAPSTAAAAAAQNASILNDAHSAAATSPAAHAAGKKLLAAPAVAPEVAAALGGAAAGHAPVPAEAAAAAAQYQYAYDDITCDGPVEESYEECDYKPGLAPVVTEATLEQVHMLLFIMAVVHIVISMLVLVMSTYKLRYWARTTGGPAEDELAAAALLPAAAAATAIQFPRTAASAAAAKAGQAAGAGADTSVVDITDVEGTSVDDVNDVEAAAAAEVPAVVVVADEQAAAAAAAAAAGTGLAVRDWRGRPAKLQNFGAWFREGCELMLRQLLVGLYPTVTHQEYSLLRATFYQMHGVGAMLKQPLDSNAHQDAAAAAAVLSAAANGTTPSTNGYPPAAAKDIELSKQHAPAAPASTPAVMGCKSVIASDSSQQHDHTQLTTAAAAAAPAAPAAPAGAGASVPAVVAGLYAPYLLECVERDGSKAVGLGLPMWLLLVAFVLLSGAVGWSTWLLLIIAGGLLLLINTSLLAEMRHITAGGQVRQQGEAPLWWLRHSRLLMSCIKLMLFFLSFVISNAIYFAAFFGPESCFFSRTGFQKESPVPWWAVMLIDLFLLASLALVTLPLYTVTTHTLRADKVLLQQLLDEREAAQGSKAAGH